MDLGDPFFRKNNFDGMVVCLGITGGFSRYVCDVHHALANFCRKLCRLELCFAAMASIASVEAWRRIQRG